MKLCIIGTGYVGLVSGTCFSDLGNKVYCVDKDPSKIKMLNSGISPIFEPGLNELIKKNHSSGRLIFTTILEKALNNSNVIFICVGTPNIKGSQEVDLKYVFSAINEIAKKTKSKKYTVGVDGPKFTGGSVPFVPGVIGKVVKTKKIIDYVKKKLR